MKKILAVLIVLFLIFVAVLVAFPIYIKPKLVEATKSMLNEQIDAKADFSDVSLSWIRNFPDLEMNVQDVKVIGNAPFEGVPLADIESFKVVTHWRTLLNQSNPEIKKIKLTKPKFYIQVLENGKANWDIAKESAPSEETGEVSNLKLSITEYEIKEGAFVYDDAALDTYVLMEGIDHKGKGDFTMDTFLLDTETEIEKLQIKYGGLAYLDKVEAEADAIIHMNMSDMVFTLRENQMRFNDLHANLEGSVGMPNNGIKYDLNLLCPDTDIRHLISLMPNVYTDDFKNVKTEGTMAMSGSVKGLQTGEQYPAFNFDVDFNDGLFKYPGRAEQLERIMGGFHISHPQGDLNSTEINIPQFEFYLEDQPFKISSNIKNPFVDPIFDFKAFGQLDLAKFAAAYPVEQLEELKGKLVMNIEGAGKMSDIEAENYQAVNMKGDFLLEEALLKGELLPDDLEVKTIKANLNPQKLYIDKVDLKIGETDLNGGGWIEHYMDYYFGDATLKGEMNLSSTRFDVNQFMTTEAVIDSTNTSQTLTYFEVPEDMDLKLTFNARKVLYDDLNLQSVQGSLLVKEEAVMMEQVKGNVFSGSAVIDGTYSTKGEGMPLFDFDNKLKDIDIQAALKNLNTLEWLAPALEFVRGRITTDIALNGKLGENQLPIPMSMSGDGSLRLLQGTIEQFEPLQKLASTLEIDALKKWDNFSAKTFFEFKDGRVEVKPFDIKKEGIAMTVQGSHGFDQSLDYVIDAMVPKNVLGKEVNSLLQGILGRVQQQGISLNVPEKVPVKFKITGNVKNPKIEADYSNILGNAKGDIKSELKEFTDSLKNEAIEIKDSLVNEAIEIKDSLVNEATEIKDSLINKGTEIKDSVVTKATEIKDSVQTEIKSKVDTFVEEKKDEAKEGVKDLIKDQIPEGAGDKAKDKLKDLFKKKPE